MSVFPVAIKGTFFKVILSGILAIITWRCWWICTVFLAKGPHKKKELTPSDISNQGRTLLVHFIHDRMTKDGVQTTLSDTEMVAPETPSG